MSDDTVHSVRRDLQQQGCTCVPTVAELPPDPVTGLASCAVSHEVGCRLGDEIARLNVLGEVPAILAPGVEVPTVVLFEVGEADDTAQAAVRQVVGDAYSVSNGAERAFIYTAPHELPDCLALALDDRVVGMVHGTDCGLSRAVVRSSLTQRVGGYVDGRCERKERGGSFRVIELLDAPRLQRPVRPGRNDPCPCASGRKFKQCCGRAG